MICYGNPQQGVDDLLPAEPPKSAPLSIVVAQEVENREHHADGDDEASRAFGAAERSAATPASVIVDGE